MLNLGQRLVNFPPVLNLIENSSPLPAASDMSLIIQMREFSLKFPPTKNNSFKKR